MKADELIKKILNKEIVSGTGIRVITPTYSTEYYFWGNWFGTKDGDKPLDNIELHLCDSRVTFEIIEERPEENKFKNINTLWMPEEPLNNHFIDNPTFNENLFETHIQFIEEALSTLITNQQLLIKEVNLLKKEDDKSGN